MRTPSWTDRILISADENLFVKFSEYMSVNLKFSDHKPVFARFLVDIKKID